MPDADQSSSHAQRTEAALAGGEPRFESGKQQPLAKAVQAADTALGSTHNPWIVFAGFFVAGLILTAILLGIMVGFHREVIEPETRGIDVRTMGLIHSEASPAMTHLMFFFTEIGSAGPVFAILAACLLWLFLSDRRRDAAGLILTVVGALILNQVLKLWFQRQRPTVPWALAHERSFSFPSGHAMMGIVVFGMIAYLLYRCLHSRAACVLDIVVAAVLIVGIGLSRVYLGVHYPTDIVGGWIGGGVWLIAAVLALEALHRLYPRKAPAQ